MKKRIFLFFVALAATATASAQMPDSHIYKIKEGIIPSVRRQISVPDILGYKSLTADFHIHTIYSDGQVLPTTRVEEAWREGIDIISITDHNWDMSPKYNADLNTPYQLAKSAAQRADIILIPGVEYTDSKPAGHLNFLFVDDANIYQRSKIEPQKAVELAAKNGAYVIYNHPGWPDNNSDLFPFQLDLIAKGAIHGIEIFNGSSFYPKSVGDAVNLNLAPIGASDVHGLISNTYDLDVTHRPLTIVLAKDRTLESVKEALFARRTVAWMGNILAGKREYITALMKGSLTISSLKFGNDKFSCLITNSSDIDYTLSAPNLRDITITAHSTTRVSGTVESLSNMYSVTNLFTGSNKTLQIPLSYLVCDEAKQVQMPYVVENLTLFDPAKEIEITSLTQGASVHYTLDGSEPTQSSAKAGKSIKIDNSSTLKIKAFKAGLEPSYTFTVQAIVKSEQPALKVKPKNQGVAYSYYEGEFIGVSQIESKGKFVKSGTLPYFDLSVAQQPDYFGILFDGYIYAPQSGVYDFTLRSDDGSVLWIDDIMVVNNDGSHSEKSVKGVIALEKGYHKYSLKYMEDYEGQALYLYWKTPSSTTMVDVPKDNLFLAK